MSKRILFDAVEKAVTDLADFHCPGLFNNQIEREGSEDVIRYPSVFVEFENIEWSESVGAHKNLQRGDVEVTLHVAFKRLDKDNAGTLDQVDKLHAAVHGLTNAAGDFTALRRVRERQDTSYDNVEVWQIVYRCGLRDCSAVDIGSQGGQLTDVDVRIESSLKIDNDVLRSGVVDGLASDT